MARTKVLVGSIVVAIAVVTLAYTSSIDELGGVTSFSIKQKLAELSLSITNDGPIPQNIKNLPISDSATGFGYGWFAVDLSSGHMQRGPGHLIGYAITLYDEQNDWQSESMRLTHVTDTQYFCIELAIENSGKVSFDENIIRVNIETSPENIAMNLIDVPVYRVDRAVAFEVVSHPKCHFDNALHFLKIKENQT
ncbi:MAG: hypothetical protein YK1309IOTA_1910015 [Marine Group I thaumarchaeote]|nr:MAG: hypothetical protein YK1309IOTA_1910015 [Marine Group I thaumarchaeote]